MRPSNEQTIIENKLSELLSREQTNKEFVLLLLESLGNDGRQWLNKRILNDSEELPRGNVDFARAIGAREMGTQDQRLLELSVLTKYFGYRKDLLATAATASDAASLLGVSRQTIHERIRTGQLLGILENNTMKLPLWQFDSESHNGMVPGLSDVINALNCSLLAKMSWLGQPNAVFYGDSPIETLKKGDLKTVLEEARSVGVA